MKCYDVMKKNVECSFIGDSVAVVADRMRSRNIGFLPVCDSDGRVIGTVTDRDLAVRVLAACCGPDVCVESVMTQNVVSCRPDEPLKTAEELMSQYKISRILCLDSGGRPAGVISLSDIAEIERSGRAAAVMRSVAQREAHL